MILVVDDISANVYSLKKVLERHGFQVDTALSGEEALKKVLVNTYVLVILDVQMPGMDGFETAVFIRGLERTRHTAILFLTANAIDVDLIAKGYRAGAADYITKPVDPVIFILRVSSLYALYDAKRKNEIQQEEIQELYTREKDLNESLNATAQKLLAAQRMARMGNWEYFPARQELKCTPEVNALLGVSPEERVDLAFFLRHLPLEERDLVIGFWSRIDGRQSFEFMHHYIPREGEVKYLRQYGRVMLGEDGTPEMISGIMQDISSQKAHEEEAQEAYNRYELVNRATNDLLWDWDVESGRVQWNQNVSKIYGYREEEVKADVDWWQSVIHPADTQHVFHMFVEAARKQERNCNCEYRMRCADGSYKEVFNQSYCLYGEAGELLRVVCAVKDLSELKRTEKDLIDAEVRLVQTIENINEGFFTCNRDWEVTYWNSHAEKMLGYSRAEAVGRNLWELFPEARTSKFFDYYSQCMLSHKPVSFEEYYLPLKRWYRVNGHYSQGGITVYFEDITDELLASQELNNAKIQADILNKATRDIIWDWDLKENTVRVNKNFATELHYRASSNPLTYKWWRNRIHPGDRKKVDQSIRRALESDLDTWEMEYRFADAAGRFHFMRDRAILFRTENDVPYRVTGSMNDIQELKEIESRMQQIAFSNSHVIRKPLANILGLIDLLGYDDAPKPELIELIRQSGEELDQAIRQIGAVAVKIPLTETGASED